MQENPICELRVRLMTKLENTSSAYQLILNSEQSPCCNSVSNFGHVLRLRCRSYIEDSDRRIKHRLKDVIALSNYLLTVKLLTVR